MEEMRLGRDKVRVEKGVFQSVHQPVIQVPQRLLQEPGDMPAIHFIPFFFFEDMEIDNSCVPNFCLGQRAKTLFDH